MSSILLSSPKAEPFGLLSNKAIINFTSEGIVWKSVSQYIFVNMFKTETLRFKMSEHVDRNPFIMMEALKNEEDNLVYQQEILKGLGIRFSQYPALRARLFETRGKELVYSDSKILSLLNNIRNTSTNTIFDPARGVEVPRKEVVAVIAGVEKEILQNPYLDDNLSYTDLIQYAAQNPQDLPHGDEIFININNIVPILKYRLRQRIWDDEIDKFKSHLLDVYLDYLLETEYPNIDKFDYRKAKNQQIMKEKNIDKYENQLFDLYLTKEIDILVTRKLQFTPDQRLKEMSQKEKEIEVLLKTPQIEGEKMYIAENDPFLPGYIEKTVVDFKNYNSVVHYAYFKLLQIIGMAKDINVNSFGLNDLQRMYDNAKQQWMYSQLKLNNETATVAKFKQNEILLHLLKATGNVPLVWNDNSDPILGVGYNNEGENLSGRFLEFLRNQPIAFGLYIVNNRKYVKNNVWEHWRVITLARDYLNTLKLLNNPKTGDLEIIYNIKGIYNNEPTEQDIVLLKMAGLNIDEIHLVYPLISTFYQSVMNFSETQVIETWVGNNEKITRRPNIQPVKEKLKAIFAEIDASVNENTFIASILANKQTSELNDAKWQRIKYWGD